jgi:Flp pilus assembly protein TadB
VLRLLGIRPNRLLIAVGGVAMLVAGVLLHGLNLIVIGGVLIVWAAITFVASRRRQVR